MPFNFHYQGRYSGDETQLTGGRPLPPDARKLDEPDDVAEEPAPEPQPEAAAQDDGDWDMANMPRPRPVR